MSSNCVLLAGILCPLTTQHCIGVRIQVACAPADSHDITRVHTGRTPVLSFPSGFVSVMGVLVLTAPRTRMQCWSFRIASPFAQGALVGQRLQEARSLLFIVYRVVVCHVLSMTSFLRVRSRPPVHVSLQAMTMIIMIVMVNPLLKTCRAITGAHRPHSSSKWGVALQ